MRLHIKYETDFEITETEIEEIVDDIIDDYTRHPCNIVDEDYVNKYLTEFLSFAYSEFDEYEYTLINYECEEAKSVLRNEVFKRVKERLKVGE